MVMKALLTCAHVLNCVVITSLITVLAVVFLNFTFTHTDLPDDNVPYYIHDVAEDPTEKSSGQYGLYWWVYATDSLRLLVPFMLLASLMILIYAGTDLTWLVEILLVLLLVWELVKFVWAVVLWIPNCCAKHQFCRALGARRDMDGEEIGDDPGKANGTYTFYTYYSLAFFVVIIIYLFLVARFSSGVSKWQRKQQGQELQQKLLQSNGASAARPVEPANAWTTLALSTLLTLTLVVFIPVAFLNFTFTNDKTTSATEALPPPDRPHLPDDKIPYYISENDDDLTEGSSGRLEFFWWWYASDILLVLVPLACMANIVEKGYGRSGFTRILQLFVVLVLLLHFVKFITAAVIAHPKLCQTQQFCRSFAARTDDSGTEIGGPPGSMNLAYSFYVWFSLALVLLVAGLLVAVSTLHDAVGRGLAIRVVPYARAIAERTASVRRRVARAYPRALQRRTSPSKAKARATTKTKTRANANPRTVHHQHTRQYHHKHVEERVILLETLK